MSHVSASQFRVLEADAGNEALTDRVVGPWVDRTPDGFVVDVRAHRLLTHHGTSQESISRGTRCRRRLHGQVRVYGHDLPAKALDDTLDRFLASIRATHEFGKLGAVVLPFPSYFRPSATSFDYLAWLHERSGDIPRGRVPPQGVARLQAPAGDHPIPRSAEDLVRRRRRSTRVRQLAPPLPVATSNARSSASTDATPTHGNGMPIPVTTASRRSTASPTSRRGWPSSRSSPRPITRCTQSSPPRQRGRGRNTAAARARPHRGAGAHA